MLIAIIVIIGLSVLILGHEAGHFIVAKLFGLKIDEFGFGFPPRIFAKKKGETEYSFNWLPFGGFVKIAGESDPAPFTEGEPINTISDEEKKRLFNFQPTWKKFLIIFAGVAINFVFGWVLISMVFAIGTPRAVVVSEVQAGSPAAEAGIAAGDILKDYITTDGFINFVNQHRGEEIPIVVSRGGKDITFNVIPRINVAPNEGAVGVAIVQAGAGRENIFSAFWDGLKYSFVMSGLVLQAFYQLLKSLVLHASLLPGVVGPVGIFSVAEETGSIGLIYLIQLISVISLNLAVINLLPLPALDGGRIFMILLEKIKGSPISRKTEAIVNSFGFAFLITLMVLLTIRDVSHLF
ncbi:MAG: site-2 protease family protein [Patescibacteria group bacterium]|nr:site-2 protease family protein [Patescibacteria group bacterium]MDE2015597.1 site-2 protease family protein [Patescibacteria group bacterium]MDE2226654.1 site-2 protease family protein [Patescibacteria group bacterium]